MRYSPEHKAATHRRIIETAGPRLKRDGIEGSGVATLMSDAGLTNGAFYTHFESKDDLVGAVVADQLRSLRDRLDAQAEPGRPGLEQVVTWYLSRDHRDDLAGGCPNAALLDEIGRCAAGIRAEYTDGVLLVVDALAARLPESVPGAARLRALSLLGLLAGTIQLARAVADGALSDELLEQGIRSAGVLLDAWFDPAPGSGRTVAAG